MQDKSKNYGFVFSELVKRGIKLKYRHSYLGILWSLIEPILSTIVLVVVFGTLLGNTNPNFPLYIVVGKLFYSFFSDGTRAVSRSIRGNAPMIKKIHVPKFLYPLSSVIYTFIIFLISLLVLIGVDIYCKVIPTLSLLMFVPSLLLLLFLTFSCGLFLTTLNVFFHDIEYLWNVVLMIIMYVSAIFYYPERILDSRWAFVLNLNPLYQIIHMGRCSVMSESFNWFGILYAFCFSVVMFVISFVFYQSKKDKFILHI